MGLGGSAFLGFKGGNGGLQGLHRVGGLGLRVWGFGSLGICFFVGFGVLGDKGLAAVSDLGVLGFVGFRALGLEVSGFGGFGLRGF